MPKLFQVVKKVVTVVAGGAVNFPSVQRAAVRVSVLFTARSAQRAGTSAVQTPTGLSILQRASGRLSATVTGTVDRPLIRPAAVATARVVGAAVPRLVAGASAAAKSLTGASKAPEHSAGRIARIKTDLAHTSSIQAGTATQDTGGAWTNVARIEGEPDGLGATLTGGLTVRTGTLRGAMAAQPNRPASLVVSHVELRYRVRVTSIAVLESLVLAWRVGTGLARTAFALTSDTTGLQTFVADLTPVLTGPGGEGLSWATMASIQPVVTGNTVVGSDTILEVDSVNINIVASETQTF